MRNLIFILSITLMIAGVAKSEVYYFDPGHTELRFIYNHAGMTDQSGEWSISDGKVSFDVQNIEDTKVEISIETNSLRTGVKDLDNHLMGEDFFHSSKHPKITFTSTRVEQSGPKNILMVGNLQIKDKIVPIELSLELTFQGEHPVGAFIDYYKGEWIAVKGNAKLLRSDFGLDQFIPIVSDEITVQIAAELKAGGWD